MTAQRRGVQYENDITNGINETTDSSTRAYRAGWADQPDVVICGPFRTFVCELKRTSQERFYIDAEQIENLLSYTNGKTSAVLIVKFTHREPVVAFINHDSVDDVTSVSPTAKGVDFHWTTSGNLRVDKPSLNDWTSSQAGRSDERTVADELGLR